MAEKDREEREEGAERDFGNEQDMPVADKFNPTLGPTEASQDMASLNQIIVPVGAYTDPNNPAAQSASVNLTLDKSPVAHPEDYGQTQLTDAEVEADPATIGMLTMEGEEGAGTQPEDDREEWKKADWQAKAGEYGLATSGTVEEIRQRVEEHEDELAVLAEDEE